MILYTVGQIVTYNNKKWLIESFDTDVEGQTVVDLKRDCYRETVGIEEVSAE